MKYTIIAYWWNLLLYQVIIAHSRNAGKLECDKS